jgi:hypothetical protein
MILFETDKKPLTYLLDQIENRDVALPDFQRSFVWEAGATRELVVSVIRSFPAGTLLLLQGGSKVFAPRPFEGASALNGDPAYLVLDGQQRLTSLFQAFFGKGTHRFFLNLADLLDGYDVDEAVEVYLSKRAKRWQAIRGQATDLMLPLEQLRSFSDWRDEVLDLRAEQGDDRKKLRTQLNELEKEYVKPVELYQFPVTTLGESTPTEAICTIFETLNRTGVKLSVFELLTARAFAKQVQLREMWRSAREEHTILADFDVDPYYILQAISVNVKKSPKRSVVLALDVEDIVACWDEIIIGMAESLTLLRDECGVLVDRWLPYQTMLVTMAAAWRPIKAGRGPAVGQRRAKLRRWFWCSVFSGSYENSPNTTTESDVPALTSWLEGGETPAVVASFRFDAERWRDITARQRAVYRGTIALLMRRSPRDFHDGTPLSKPIIDGRAVDDHHIFPRGWLASVGKAAAVDTVLNHTLIDKTTNILIGKRPPSSYLQEMRTKLQNDLPDILASHGLPSDTNGPLFRDSFADFLEWRLRYLEGELRTVTSG